MLNTVVVWVLVLWTGNGPVVIDNIATRQQCQAFVTAYAQASHASRSGTCISVQKVRL